MKKNIFLLSLIPVLSLSACGSNSSISTNNSDYSSSSTSSNSNIIEDSSSENLKPGEAKILIEYAYKSGEVFGQEEQIGIVGEEYSFDVPTVNFMNTDIECVDFKLESNGFYKRVYYDYSYELIEKVENSLQYDKFMYDENKGLSFNFVVSGSSSHWDVLFENDNFQICNGYLVLKDDDFRVNFKTSSAVKSNNFASDIFLSKYNNDINVSISINPDKSVSFYKNGLLAYTWLSGFRPDTVDFNNTDENKYFVDFVDAVIKNIKESGFTVGAKPINFKNFFIGYSLDDKEAKKIYENRVHTQIKYIDEFGNELLEAKSIVDTGGNEYKYYTSNINYFNYDRSFVEGVTDVDKVEYVKYTFQGTEVISQQMKNNKSNILDRKNTFQWSSMPWFTLANNINGDFIIRLNYHLQGTASKVTSSNGGDDCWRTNLTIIEDVTTKDRHVNRLDWHGWFDDVNGDGKKLGNNANYSTSYLDNYQLDIFNVYNDCNITETITRTGKKIVIDHIIVPNKKGYENMIYNYQVSLDNVSANNLNICMGAEDAIVTFNSVKVRDL